MRKLSKHKIHPSPPPTTDHPLSLLPLAIATLAASLTSEDKEVLSYLLSCSLTSDDNIEKNMFKTTDKTHESHPTKSSCYCFACYMSYWIRWDASPNRQVIHEIIDAYEDGLADDNNNINNINSKKKSGKNNYKKERKKQNKVLSSSSSSHAHGKVAHAPTQVEENGVNSDGDGGGQDELTSSEKGSVRKFVSFVGERIWGVWGI